MKLKRILLLSLLHTFTTSLVKGVFVFAAMRRFSRLFVALVLLALPLFFLTRVGTHVPTAYAATSDNLNFQARLQTSTGAIVPDGFYNVEFKLYDALSGGTLLWTETRYDSNGVTAGNDNRVRVVNGYLTVNLGDITSFPGTMPWDQQLYLTMNVGGTAHTATPTYDGEMSPRLKLTAVPYAFNAKTASQLVTTSGALSSTLSIQAPTNGSQIFQIADQGAAGTYTLLTQNTANSSYIQLQGSTPGTAQTGNFNISGTGIANVLQGATSVLTPTLDTATAVALNIGTTNATSINLNQNTVVAAGKSITLSGGNTASRPASPTEGMLYFDTATKQLLVYANGKWQSDRSTSTKIVAASNSSQTVKDGADYVVSGNADDEINAALTAAAGGKVYLAEGTYVVGASIRIPNNTTLAGAGNGTVVELADLDADANMITNTDTSTGTGVVVRDMKLDGRSDLNTAGLQAGIFMWWMGSTSNGRPGGIFENLQIVRFRTYSMVLTSSEANVVKGNTFKNTQIFINGAFKNIVQGNQFLSGALITLNAGSASNVIDGNVITNSGSYGITVNGPSNTISNNEIISPVLMGIRLNSSGSYFASNNVLIGNRISDSGGASNNNAVYFEADADNNQITNNYITDSSATTTNYAINIVDSTSDNNYLADNRFSSTPGTATINDAGTNTRYAGQSMSEGGLDIRFKQPASTAAVNIQNANGVNVTNIDTTNGELELGNYNGGTNAVGGKIVFATTTNANTVTLSSAAQTNGSYTLSIPNLTGNDTICTQTTGCGTAGANTALSNLAAVAINTSLISDTDNTDDLGSGALTWRNGYFGTSVQTPLIDTVSAGALSIGTTNATQINLNQSTVLAAGESITITGGNTASRPGSPTDGMVYYDTTTKQLLVYNSGTSKWQADRSDAVLVAASNSSDADKAAADYVADGNTGAANDGDQVQINSALTAAAGKKVVLLAGTYVADASISVPNNTMLSGVGDGTVITIPNSFNASINMISNTDQTTGTGVVIRDLKLDGNKANQTSGAQNGVFFNDMGAVSTDTRGATLENLLIDNLRTTAIEIDSSELNTINNVTVMNATSYGISVLNTSNHNKITNSTVKDGLIGVYLAWGENNVISNNVIEGITDYGVYSSTNKSVISDNTFKSNKNAIYLNFASYNTINGNNIADSSNESIIFVSAALNTITDNSIVDSGGSTNNNAIYLSGASSDRNTIANNKIFDSSASTNNYAISISTASADDNYLTGNVFRSTPATSTINDASASTIYAGQAVRENGLDIRFKQAASTAAVSIQNANGVNVTNVDTTNGELELGNYNGGVNAVGGKIVFATTTNANTVTLASAAQTNGNYTLSIPNLTGNDTVCLQTLANCAAGPANFIQNQYASQQTGDYWISGIARADTNILTPTLDTATAVALNIGTTNATSINLNQSTVLAAGESITITGGNTASRPGSPTEGMVYYDTTTKQLLTYANGKWQADRSTATKIVAASNSSQAVKDSADYVADGTDDQVEINAALTAAAGGKVYLAEGTYTTHRTANGDATIFIPNNTTLAGAGRGTVIQLGDIDVTDNLIQNTDTTTGTGVVVQDLQLDGQKTLNTGGNQYGIYLNGMGDGTGGSARQGAKITGLWVNNFNDTGIRLNNSDNNTITDTTAQNNSFNGFAFYAASTNNAITGNTAEGNSSGFYFDASGNNNIVGNIGQDNDSGLYLNAASSNNAVTGNTFQNNNSDGFIVNAASNNNTITGNTIHTNGNYGLSVYSSNNNVITGNKLHDNDLAANNNGIFLSAADANSITNNDITDTAATTTNYAININNSTSDNNYLAGNRFSTTPATATIRDLGTGTIYAGQAMSEGGLDIRFKQANSATAFNVQNGSGVAVLNVDTSTNTVQVAGAFTSSGGAVNVNANSNFAVNIATGTSTGAVSIGGSSNTTTLGSNTINLGTTGANTTLQGATQGTLNTAGNGLTLQGSTGNGTGAGGTLTIKGGTGGATNANGGNVIISGGAATGTGTQGLVTFSTSAFTSSSTQSFASSGSLTAGLVDQYSTIPASATATGVTVTVPAPAAINQVVGRLLYLANVGTNDFNILLAGTSINISLKPDSTATLIWNGTGWTAAGASSSTDLQSAYNNTLTSAGGAELILNPAGGAADGLTIRNNGTTPISGGILEVQSAIGTNLFSVNSRGTELAANGGAETAGASSTTFPASTWTGSGASVSRTVTVDEHSTGQAAVKATIGNNQSVVNDLTASPVVSTTYTVSFTAKPVGSSANYQVQYSPTGGTNLVSCSAYPQDIMQTLPADVWSKVTCTITTAATVVTDPLLFIEKTNAGSITLLVDNLSFIRNDATTQPANVQIGGGITGGQVTLFTLDRSSSPPVANGDTTYYGSMYYDTTSGRIQCYESDGWGACGSAPDNIVVLTPEYSNAVLNGTGVGTLTADFCANKSGTLTVGTLCASGDARNFYRWTSPQPTAQEYSLYVSYKLPSTFKNFYDNNTIKLTGYRDNSSNANLEISTFRSTGADITQCGSTTQITSSTNTWESTSLSGTGEMSCGFQAGEYLIFKIDVTAQSNANVYVENLEFRYTNT